MAFKHAAPPRPQPILSVVGAGDRLGTAVALNLQFVTEEHVLTEQGHARDHIVPGVAFVEHQHRDVGVLEQARRHDAARGSAWQDYGQLYGQTRVIRNLPPTMI